MGNPSTSMRLLTPERPAKAAFQNAATPMPIGETTPRPVMTTRVLMVVTGTATE
jgi:hypothetical protein